MADYVAFWAHFKQDTARGERRTLRWFTNAELLSKMIRGDHLWLVASGESCDLLPAHHGFLAQEFIVQSVAKNRDEFPEYPSADFQFVVEAQDSARTRAFDPPINIDPSLRIKASTAKHPIGTVLQAPRQLTPDIASKLYVATQNAPLLAAAGR